MKEDKETEVKKDVKPTTKKETKKTGTSKTTTKNTTAKKGTTTKKATTAKKGTTTKKATTTKKSTSTTAKKKVEKPVVETVKNEEKVEKKEIVVEEKDMIGKLEAELQTVEKELDAVEEELQQEVKIELKAQDKAKEVKVEKVEETESKPKFEPVKKVEPKKKNHRLLKTILFLVIIALILFLVNYARNYYIISKLTEMQAEIAKSTNYSFVTEHYSTNDINNKSVLEHYYKDGKNMMIRDQGEKVIIWNDTETKETIYLVPQTLTATIEKNRESSVIGNTLPIRIEENDIEPKWSFMFLITSEEVNGQDCYKIRWTMDGATIWINKENGMTVKSMNGKAVVDGKQYDSITEWKNVKFNKLTDADMLRPNLMGYTVREND